MLAWAYGNRAAAGIRSRAQRADAAAADARRLDELHERLKIVHYVSDHFRKSGFNFKAVARHFGKDRRTISKIWRLRPGGVVPVAIISPCVTIAVDTLVVPNTSLLRAFRPGCSLANSPPPAQVASVSAAPPISSTMTQVAPLSEVTVVTFDPTDSNEKQELLQHDSNDKSLRKQKLVVGILYTLVAVGMLYLLVAAVSFVGDVFTLLLVLTRH